MTRQILQTSDQAPTSELCAELLAASDIPINTHDGTRVVRITQGRLERHAVVQQIGVHRMRLFLHEAKERQRRTLLRWLSDALREVAAGQSVVHDEDLDDLVDEWIDVVLQHLRPSKPTAMESKENDTASMSKSSSDTAELKKSITRNGSGILPDSFVETCVSDPYAAAVTGVMSSAHITRNAQRGLIAVQRRVGTPGDFLLPNEHRTKRIEVASDAVSTEHFQLSPVAALDPKERKPLGYTVAVAPCRISDSRIARYLVLNVIGSVQPIAFCTKCSIFLRTNDTGEVISLSPYQLCAR